MANDFEDFYSDDVCDDNETIRFVTPEIPVKIINKPIRKLVIKTEYGLCAANCAYTDKMIIRENSLSYECKPEFPNSVYKPVKWSYKSNSREYSNWFNGVIECYKLCMEKAARLIIYDVGYISFSILYDDGSRQNVQLPLYGDDFLKLMEEINKMVPPSETVPVMVQNIIEENCCDE